MRFVLGCRPNSDKQMEFMGDGDGSLQKTQ